MGHKAVFNIAGIGYSLEKRAGEGELNIDSSHARFLSDREPELRFQAANDPWPTLEGARRIFDSGSYWSIYSAPGAARFISFCNPRALDEENRRAVLSADFRSGTIYSRNIADQVFPLSYPLEELIYISVLPEYHGVIIHSCGLATPEGGYLFVGVSGAGKSTITKIFQRETPGKVLSDDRIIVRRQDGQFWMHGTPWHGEVDVCENFGVPLKKIFFIKHFTRNTAERLGPLRAAMTLLARSFPPFWDKGGMEKTTNLCADIAEHVPCYELGFVPDKSILPFISTLDGC